MAIIEPLRVFVSYARKDGIALARQLASDLAQEGFNIWLDTNRIASGSIWSGEIERAIDSCQVMVALITSGSYGSEICRSEQIRALDRGKRLIPILAETNADRPIFLYSRQYLDFTDMAAYAGRLAELIADIRGDATATLPACYRETRVNNSPPRVTNYLERPEPLRALRDAIFAEDDRQPIAITALSGMGGIGKTVLAKAITDDEAVRRAYPDGIVWVQAGREETRDLTAEMREIGKALGDDPKYYDTPLASANRYRTLMANKAALIVIDDVWSKADIQAFQTDSRRSRILFTTRDSSIARFVGAREERVDLLNPAQARTLLALWAGLAAGDLPAEADDIICECAGLPLALSTMGAFLRGGEPAFWRYALVLLRAADLSAIRQHLPPGQESFFRAVEVSVQSLQPDLQKRYKALAVLGQDMAAPAVVIQRLWNATALETRKAIRLLTDRSLAYAEGESLRLHDLQCDYVRSLHPDQAALELIRGAIQLSATVLSEHPEQFTSQIAGRLLPYRDTPAINEFIDHLAENTPGPWLRPMNPSLYPPGTGLVGVMAHSHPVTAVALSSDGRTAITAAGESVRVWDVRGRRQIHLFPMPSHPVRLVALSARGHIGVVVARDGTLRVLDVAQGRELHSLQRHTDQVASLALTPDGLLALTGSMDGIARIWDTWSGRETFSLEGHSAPVISVALDRTGHTAVTASEDGTVRVWDARTGCQAGSLVSQGFEFVLVHCNAEGTEADSVISKQHHYYVVRWDLKTGKQVSEFDLEDYDLRKPSAGPDFARHPAWAVNADGSMFVFASGRYIKLAGEARSPSFAGHAEDITGLAISADGRIVLSSSKDKTVMIWEPQSRRWISEASLHLVSRAIYSSPPVVGLAVGAGPRRAFRAGSYGIMGLWDADRASEVPVAWPNWPSPASDIASSRNGRLVLTINGSALYVWAPKRRWKFDPNADRYDELPNSRFIVLLKEMDLTAPRTLHSVVLSADGRTALTADDENVFVFRPPGWRSVYWDLFLEPYGVCRDKRRFQPCPSDVLQGAPIKAIAIAADGRMGSAASDKNVAVWNLQSGRQLVYSGAASSPVTSLALNSNGRMLVEALDNCALRVIELPSGKDLRVLSGHSMPAREVAFSPDDRLMASVSGDRTVRVWDPSGGTLVAMLTCDSDVLSTAYMSHDRILAGDASGHVHFLSLDHFNA